MKPENSNKSLPMHLCHCSLVTCEASNNYNQMLLEGLSHRKQILLSSQSSHLCLFKANIFSQNFLFFSFFPFSFSFFKLMCAKQNMTFGYKDVHCFLHFLEGKHFLLKSLSKPQLHSNPEELSERPTNQFLR